MSDAADVDVPRHARAVTRRPAAPADGPPDAADARSAHDADTERVLIGAVLLAGGLDRVRGTEALAGEDFYLPAHRAVFAALATLAEDGTSANLVTVKDTLRAAGTLEVCGGVCGVSALLDDARGLGLTDLSDHAASLRRLARVRARARGAGRLAALAAVEDDDDGARGAERARLLAELQELEADGAAQAPRFVAAAALMREAPPVAVVEGAAFAGRVSLLAGESGSGKSFVALSWAAHVCDGRAWAGRACARASVGYLAFESDDLGARLQALHERGFTLDGLFVVRASSPLSPVLDRAGAETPSVGEREAVAALRGLGRMLRDQGREPVRLVIIDTVRASLAGSEDLSEPVAGYLRAVRRILAQGAPEAAALLLHHAPWQDGETRKRRERGSSAFRGCADVTLYLEAGDFEGEPTARRLVLRTLKVRDQAAPAPLHLLRVRVDLPGFDGHGQPLSSCVVEPDPTTRAEREAAEGVAAEAEAQALALEALRVMSRPGVTSKLDVRDGLGVKLDAARAAVGRALRFGWATAGGRGKPYQVTEAGRAALAEAGWSDESNLSNPSEPGSNPEARVPNRTRTPLFRAGSVRHGSRGPIEGGP